MPVLWSGVIKPPLRFQRGPVGIFEELNPVFKGLPIRELVGVGIGGLLHLGVVPGIRSIVRPGAGVRKEKIAVGLAAQHGVDERHGLGAGDGLLGAEGIVAVAVNPSGLSGLVDVCCCPVTIDIRKEVGA